MAGNNVNIPANLRQIRSAVDVEGDWHSSCNKSVVARTGKLLDEGRFSDVTLKIGKPPNTKDFQVHKCILGISSPVFEAMFYGPLSEQTFVEITDIEPTIFQKLLNYVYKDEFELQSMIEAWDLWYAANKYLYKDLVERCAEYISRDMNESNVLEAFEKAVQCDEVELESKCLKLIDEKASEIFHQLKFAELSHESMRRIICRPTLDATESEIFEGLILWDFWTNTSSSEPGAIERPVSPSCVRSRVTSFLPYLQFEKMTPDEFLEVVCPSGILTSEELSKNLQVMIRKLLPSNLRRETRKFSSQVSCKRGSGFDTSYWPVSSTSHYLCFSIQCAKVICFLTGIRVSEYFKCRWYNSVDLYCCVTDSKNVTMASFNVEGPNLPFDVDLPYPMPVKDGEQYCIHFKVQQDTCNVELEYFLNCYSQVTCGELTVNFQTDPRSDFTTAEKGLISQLHFHVLNSNRSGPASNTTSHKKTELVKEVKKQN